MITLEEALRQTLADPPVSLEDPADPLPDIERRIGRRRRRIITAAVAAIVVVVGITVPLSLPSGTDQPAHQPAEPQPPSVVVAAAKQIGADSRSAPVEVRWVQSTADAVPRIPRIDQRGLDDIYLVEVSGKFALPHSCPYGARPYQCESLYPLQLTIVPVTGQADDIGTALRQKPYDLASFGTVHTFTLPDVPSIPTRIAAAANSLAALRLDDGPTKLEWVQTTERNWRKSGARHPDRQIYIIQVYGEFADGDEVATTAITVSGDPGEYSSGTRATPRELREIGAVHTFTIR